MSNNRRPNHDSTNAKRADRTPAEVDFALSSRDVDSADVDSADADLADALLAARVLLALRPAGGVTGARLGRLRGLFCPAACGDVPFGFVVRGCVFFKSGPETVTKYIARSSRPYLHGGVRQPLRDYWLVPSDVLNDPEMLPTWALGAIDAARRYGKRRRATPRRKAVREPRRNGLPRS